MSRVLNNAFQEVRKSEFIFKDGRELEVRDAVIIWSNFAGKEDSYGNSARTFNLVLNDEIAEVLNDNGWRVKEREIEDGNKVYFVNIKVNFDSAYPPTVALFSEFRGKKSKRVLDVESVGELDSIDIQTADCTINAYASKKFGGSKVTGYLKKLHVIQEPDVEFGGKYDDWLENDVE